MAEYLIPAAASILIAVIEIIAAKDRKAAKEDSKKTEARAAVAGLVIVLMDWMRYAVRGGERPHYRWRYFA